QHLVQAVQPRLALLPVRPHGRDPGEDGVPDALAQLAAEVLLPAHPAHAPDHEADAEDEERDYEHDQDDQHPAPETVGLAHGRTSFGFWYFLFYITSIRASR